MASARPSASRTDRRDRQNDTSLASRAAADSTNTALAGRVQNMSIDTQDIRAWDTCIEIIVRWPVYIKIRICWGHNHRGRSMNAAGQIDEADELLDCNHVPPNSVYQQQGPRFYEIGRVFAVPWSNETQPPNAVGAPKASGITGRDERVFVVVRSDAGYCLALPVSAVPDQATRGSTAVASVKGLIFTERRLPAAGEPGISAQPIRVQLDERNGQWNASSCVEYNTTSKVMFNVPVRGLGRIHEDSYRTFIDNFQSTRSRNASLRSGGVPATYSQPSSTVAAGTSVPAGFLQRPTAHGSSASTAPTQSRGVEQVSTAAMNARILQFRRQGYTSEQIMQVLAQSYTSRGYSREQAASFARQAMSQYSEESDEDEDDDDEDDDEDSSEDSGERNYTTRGAPLPRQANAPRQVVAAASGSSAEPQAIRRQVAAQPQSGAGPAQRITQAGPVGSTRKTSR